MGPQHPLLPSLLPYPSLPVPTDSLQQWKSSQDSGRSSLRKSRAVLKVTGMEIVVCEQEKVGILARLISV